ncbi:MAG: uroporphyrinogen-III C-methyltransferase [Deltaproteobacteria bacterium]|nr:uroporphyrinogen-III C-methyltransferase [Deltaproteobacteria bacterium]
MTNPKVYIVGAGPGDAGLITLKGVLALKQADVVIYDFLASSRLLEYTRPGVTTVYVGKKGRFRHCSQEEINRLIVRYAKKGRTVVRLKGGDPFIFGRGAEEALALAEEGIPFEVIPGVTSATAAPAYAGIPLTHRDFSSSVTFLTGQESPEKEISSIDWTRLSRGGTLVILMGWKNISGIVKKLVENGRPASTPVAMIRWGTLSRQRCVTATLGTLAAKAKKEGLLPPVVIVVGDVVRLRERLNWFETKPLFGKRVLVTRALEQAGEFSKLLEENGAEPIIFPVIKTVPPKSYTPVDRAIGGLEKYDWAIFTSANGVKYFFERLYSLGRDVRELKGVNICAIGPATAGAIKERGINVDLTPGRYRAEAIVKALGKNGIQGKRFLLPRAEKAREVLPGEIKRLGGRIDVVPVYRTIRPVKEARGLKKLVASGGVDIITFTSSSTVENFAGLFKKDELKRLLKGVHVACIGPVTADTAKKQGLKVDIMPKDYTIPALTEAIAGYFEGR